MDENTELTRCIDVLQKGGVVVVPSDTVYGLACDATNEDAVRQLIAIKNRPLGKPISVFVSDFKMMNEYVELGEHSLVLQTLLPGPFTIILPSKNKVAPQLESEKGTLGVRFPRYTFITTLVKRYGKPITATSANISGRPPHYEPDGFLKELSQEKRKHISYCVDYGKLPHNKTSTIINFSGEDMQLLRKGDVVPVSQTKFISESPNETKKIARYMGEKYWDFTKEKPLIFILKGDMGVGKTIFAKGIGDCISVPNIISPTYVVYYEYEVKKKNVRTFVHADLFNIEEQEEFSHLGLHRYFKKNTIICIEWGEKMGTMFNTIKQNAKIILVEMEYEDEKKRIITMHEL